MTAFSIEVRMNGKNLKIQRSQRFLTMGSCFSDHLGKYLQVHKFDVRVNPLGIVYNPYSLSLLIDQIADPSIKIGDEMLVHNDGLWHSWLHHGQFSRENKDDLLLRLEAAIKETNLYFHDLDYLIITLGSAHAYRLQKTGMVVSNCHKVPAGQFEKVLQDSNNITAWLSEGLKNLRSLNPKLQVILTVSPVRYIRDGLIENNLSKAQLITAAHNLTSQLDFCTYFPAYEIIIDELRDYRFYDTDMVHPGQQAIDYVLSKFIDHHFLEDAKEQVRVIGDLQRSINHRPHHPQSAAHRQFRQQLKSKIFELVKQYPDLNFDEELLSLS